MKKKELDWWTGNVSEMTKMSVAQCSVSAEATAAGIILKI